MVVKKGLFISLECGFVCRSLLDVIERKGLDIEYFDHVDVADLDFKRKFLFYVNFIVELLKRKELWLLVIGSPISFRLILWLNIILLFVKPRRLVLLIPPSERHVDGLKLFAYSSLISFLLLLIKRRGVRVLLIYTSPIEKQVFEQVFHSEATTYYPVFSWDQPRSAPKQLRENPPVLFVYALNEYQVKWLPGALVFLEELGVKPLIIVGFEDEPRRCINHPLITCIYSSDYDKYLMEATIVIALHVSPESNLVIAKAIGYKRPVITRRVLGMGRVYEDTGLITYQDVIGPENLATTILNVLNNLDKYRQIGLRTVILPPKTRYFEEIFHEFLLSETSIEANIE